jgi:hypothetical protein
MKGAVPKLLLGLFALLLQYQAADAEVQRTKFISPAGYLIVEALDDDLLHFEVSAIGEGPPEDLALYTSPMVLKTDYGAPLT